MLIRIWQLAVKEFIQFRRDRMLTAFVLTFPLLQLVLVAQTAGSNVSNLPLAIMDQDRSFISRSILTALDNTEELTLRYLPDSRQEVERLLDSGQAALAVIIPPALAADLAAGSWPQIQVLVDGSNTSSGSTALRAAEGAIASHLAGSITPARGAVELRTRIRFNQELDGKYVAIPGLLAFAVYQVAIVTAAVSLVRERELGTLEQLAVTPVRTIELLTGKAIPAFLLGLVNFAVLFLIVIGAFGIPMRGSWSLVFLLSALFIITEVGWGLMVSTLSRSQQQAVLIVFPLSMIDFSLSGYLVPVENMPLALQGLSALSPLRYYMAILRDIMLKDATLVTLWPSASALVGLAVAVGLLTLRNVTRNFE